MIPSNPVEFDERSREGEMFESLEKLPDDYYVFHSMKIVEVKNNVLEEHEADYVVFNRTKGILVIEAKAGEVSCEDGIWRYESGLEMKMDPFRQANANMWRLKEYIEKLYGNTDITRNCKMLYCAWFPGINNKRLNNMVLPTNISKDLILTGDDLENPLPSIERIFSVEVRAGVTTQLTDREFRFLMDNVFCPSVNILPSKTMEIDYKKQKFRALLKEQCVLLDFLEEQRTAVINGQAGTGKTMIALEKARRHSVNGDTVLFLCFNVKLKEYLETNYNYKNVDYYTIDGFACKLGKTSVPDYDLLWEELMSYCGRSKKEFPWKHIIVDEGQDFGQSRMQIDMIFQCFEEIALNQEGGSFYVFYDKLQMVQSFEVPEYIENADCRLTLYRNCRNTKPIADTSMRPFPDSKKKKMSSLAASGAHPTIHFIEGDFKAALDNNIKELKKKGYDNIQILSCAPSDVSEITEYLDGDYYPYRGTPIPFTTARKFKGLEADAIIMIDVDTKSLTDDTKLFYVASSRARLELVILTDMTDDDCTYLIGHYGKKVFKNDPKGTLAKNILGCLRT